MKILKIYFLFFAIIMMSVSCKKEETPLPMPDPKPTYTVPTTYNFSNVNYTGQTQRLAMLDVLSSYMKSGNTSGIVLDAQKMKDIYSNTGNPFSDASLNTSGKQLKNKTYSADQTLFEAYFDSLAQASQSTTVGSNGVAGVVSGSSDPSKKYLFDKNGIEYNQLITKGLMGAAFYYQAVSAYLENIVTADNNTVITGEGTKMEHNWDEAFGYLGVPIDFPSNITGIKYWGSYSNQRNAVLSSNSVIMNAFLKGRAAISNKDNTARDEARTTIRDTWEKICVGSAIHYINAAKTHLTDDALRNHELSECLGFVMSLKYSNVRKITDAQIAQVQAFIGNNLYNVTTANLDNAKNLLVAIYGMDNIKDSL
jgi:hypothetical protein